MKILKKFDTVYLRELVSRLLNAATSQWEIPFKLYLLKAAKQGKTFITKNEFSFQCFVSDC